MVMTVKAVMSSILTKAVMTSKVMTTLKALMTVKVMMTSIWTHLFDVPRHSRTDNDVSGLSPIYIPAAG